MAKLPYLSRGMGPEPLRSHLQQNPIYSLHMSSYFVHVNDVVIRCGTDTSFWLANIDQRRFGGIKQCRHKGLRYSSLPSQDFIPWLHYGPIYHYRCLDSFFIGSDHALFRSKI
jgi:hypothetical protein